MLDQMKRSVYFYDSNMKSEPETAPTIPLENIIRELYDKYNSGEAVKLINNETAALRIKDMDFDEKNNLVLMLIQYSDKNASDPVFGNLETGTLRVEPKLDGEGVAVSAHLIISLTSNKTPGFSYLTLLESVPGLSRSKIEPFLTSELKSVCTQYFRDVDGKKKKCRPIIDMVGHMSQTLKEDLGKGSLLGMSLIRYGQTENDFDEQGVTIETQRQILLKVGKVLDYQGKIDLINSIKEKARKKGYTDMRIKFKKGGKERSIPLETDEKDAADALYTRCEQISLRQAVPQCIESFNQGFIDQMTLVMIKERDK